MPSFAYTARDTEGKMVSDTVSAESRKAALRILAVRNLQPVKLTEQSESRRVQAVGVRRSRDRQQPGPQDLLPFLKALTELTASGLSSGESLRMLATRLKDPRLRALCGVLWGRLKEGQTLSLAMENSPVVFDLQAVNLVRAAEATGSLNEVLQRLIQHHTEQRALKQKLATAMTYPIFVCVVAFGVILFFVFFLLPRLQGLLSSLGGKLPWSTQLLVGSSELLVRYGVIILPGMALAALLFWRWRKTERGRVIVDRQLVKIPVIKIWVIDSGVLAFVQTLAVLLENGINTVEALRLTEKTVPNRTMRAALRGATERVLEGDSLSAALMRTGFFPDLVLDRLAVGESTGNLAPCLRDIARYYAIQHTQRLEHFVGVTANAVLLGAFAFVGFLAYAIVSAVLRVSSSFHF